MLREAHQSCATEVPSISRGESGAWAEIDGKWQPLAARFREEGWSLEWHDFRVDREMNWSQSFHPGSLEICLNFSGAGSLADGAKDRTIGPEQIALYLTDENARRAVRKAGSWHRFLTVECSPDFLRRYFVGVQDRLKGPILHFLTSGCASWLEIGPLPPVLQTMRKNLLEPPVPEAARPAWYQAKVVEILAHTIFEPDEELFCQRQMRLNRERAERVCQLLERDLENPSSLEMLAEDVGCSPSHLSRIFAEVTGGSIPKFLRTKRIDKAGELLAPGKMNVTEAALAVGYASLGAFNKAFVEQMGCCPGLYPALKSRRKTEP